MRTTGMVRRIDELGRVVIPKEIRKTMRLKVGEELEIYVEGENELVFKKYSALGRLQDLAKPFAEAMYAVTGADVFVSDTDRIIAVSQKQCQNAVGSNISPELEKYINGRRRVNLKAPDCIRIFEGAPEATEQLISPIIWAGDAIGAVVFIAREKPLENIDHVLADYSVQFFGRLN